MYDRMESRIARGTVPDNQLDPGSQACVTDSDAHIGARASLRLGVYHRRHQHEDFGAIQCPEGVATLRQINVAE